MEARTEISIKKDWADRMEQLIEQIKTLEKSEIGEQIRAKRAGFKKNRATRESIFSELCFCLLTANSSAEMGINIQNEMRKDNGFERLSEKQLSKALRALGYRFYNVRAAYIVLARKQKENVWAMIRECHNEFELRDWLVDNIKGLGYKEASHFLRNLGFYNLAILDRHILRTLHEKKLIDTLPSSLDEKKYLKYEKEMEKICRLTNLKQGELDFYLWYLKTGKALK